MDAYFVLFLFLLIISIVLDLIIIGILISNKIKNWKQENNNDKINNNNQIISEIKKYFKEQKIHKVGF